MSTPKTATAKKAFAFILGVLFFVLSPLAGLTQGTDSVTSSCNKNPQACIDLGILQSGTPANQIQPFARNIVRKRGLESSVIGTTNGVGTADLTIMERLGAGITVGFMGAAAYDAIRKEAIRKNGTRTGGTYNPGLYRFTGTFYHTITGMHGFSDPNHPKTFDSGPIVKIDPFTITYGNTQYATELYPATEGLSYWGPGGFLNFNVERIRDLEWSDLNAQQRAKVIEQLTTEDFQRVATPTEIDLNPQPGDEFYFEDAPDRRIAWDPDPYPYHSPTPNPTPTFSPVPSPTPTNSPLLPPPEPDPTPTPQPSPNPSPSPSPSPEPSPSPSPCSSPPPSIAPTPTATGTPKVVDPEEILNKSCDGNENVFSYGICKLKDRFPLDILSGPSPGSNPECPQLEFFGQELPEFCEIINGHLSGVKWLIWFLFSLRAITYL